MIHTENFGYTVRCGSVGQAEKLKERMLAFGLLTTRTISLGQYVQIFLDPHEKHDDARECWKEWIRRELV